MSRKANPIERIPASWQAGAIRALYELPRPVRRLLAGKPIRIDGQQLDPDVQLLVKLQARAGMALGLGTPAQARIRMSAGTPMVGGPVIEPVDARELTIPAPHGSLGARLYTPVGLAAGSPLLVFYHGGGWVIGDLDTHDNVCRFLALHAGVRVLSVDYRLAPEHPFPAAVDDALTAFTYAVEHAETLGADPAVVAVGGDSAGGNLAAVVSHLSRQADAVGPVFALLLYPAVDATVRRPSRELFGNGPVLTSESIDWFSGHYIPDIDQRADPRFSVLLSDDLRGFPPTYLVTAGFDPLRDEGEAFADRLASDGVRVMLRRHADLVHGFANFIGLGTRSREAMAETAGALRTGIALSRPKPKARRTKTVATTASSRQRTAKTTTQTNTETTVTDGEGGAGRRRSAD